MCKYHNQTPKFSQKVLTFFTPLAKGLTPAPSVPTLTTLRRTFSVTSQTTCGHARPTLDWALERSATKTPWRSPPPVALNRRAAPSYGRLVPGQPPTLRNCGTVVRLLDDPPLRGEMELPWSSPPSEPGLTPSPFRLASTPPRALLGSWRTGRPHRLRPSTSRPPAPTTATAPTPTNCSTMPAGSVDLTPDSPQPTTVPTRACFGLSTGRTPRTNPEPLPLCLIRQVAEISGSHRRTGVAAGSRLCMLCYLTGNVCARVAFFAP